MNFEVFSQESIHEHIQRHVYTNEITNQIIRLYSVLARQATKIAL